MKHMIKSLCICALAVLIAAGAAACGSDTDSDDSGAKTESSSSQTKKPAKPSTEEMESAVHNPVSDAFCDSINNSGFCTMEMFAEGNNIVWELTLKRDLDEADQASYIAKFEENPLTENLSAIRDAVQYDIRSTDFGMIVRYFTKDGKLLLEQSAFVDDSGSIKTDSTSSAPSGTEAPESDTEQETQESTDAPTPSSAEPTAEDMNIAVHNPLSEGFCNKTNQQNLLSMEMHAEDSNIVWDLTFKQDQTEASKEAYIAKFNSNPLTENLSTIRDAVRNDVSSTNFGMIVRYHTKDGELILEQTA